MKTLGYVVSFILLASLVAACGSTPAPVPTQQPATAPPPAATEPAPGGAGPDLAGILWKWEAFNDKGETHIPVDDPDKYTLVLLPDGRAQIQADCNQVTWTYSVDGDRLTFDTLGSSTLAFCGEGSRDQEYLGYLGQVVAYIVDGERLFLDLRDEAGNIVFLNGGPAEEAGQGAQGHAVTGTVVAEGNPGLPQGAKLEVRVEDVSLADAVATQVGGLIQEIISFPAHFQAPYNAQLIDPKNTYGLTVRVTDAAGSLLYINTQAYNVLTQGYPTRDVEVLVEPVGGQPPTGGQIPLGGIGIGPASIQLDTLGLPYSWQANLVPATPYDASQPPGPRGLPEHIQINFSGDPTARIHPDERQPGDPILYIIPVEAYKAMYEENGDQGVAVTVDMQLEMLQDRPRSFPKNGVPVLPFEEVAGYNDLAVQGSYPDFGAFGGQRFVGRIAQDANPVTNEGLRYIFQGYAGEASEYLIAFFYPVSTEALPLDMEEVPAEEQASATEDPEPYLNEKADMLNGLAESDWEPDLSLLDSVLGSLRFETTSSGRDLAGKWQWQRSTYNDDTELVVDDPSRYTVEFKADGTLDIQADCNQLSWTYTREGNSLTINSLGTTTLASCGEDSLDQQFLADLSGVATYVFHEGQLVLNIWADVGNMIFGR